MRIATSALGHDRLTLFCALIITLGGLLVLSRFPSQEEPTIPVKQAIIVSENDSLSIWETEALLAKPLEMIVEQLPEVSNIHTTVRAGKVQLRVELADNHSDTDAAWSRLRARIATAELPRGSLGPFIDDDFGRVAVATYAVVPDPGYNWGDTRLAVNELVNDLDTLTNVGRITVTGMQPERIVITLSREELARLELSVNQIAELLNADTSAGPSGFLRTAGQLIEIDADGRLRNLEELRNLRLPLNDGGAIALRDIADISREALQPPRTLVRFGGRPAVVIGVEMQPDTNVQIFGQELKNRMRVLADKLPVGFELVEVSFQADVVSKVINGMQRTLYLTVAVVLIVTIIFLGWRTGLIVGLSIPLTMLGALLVMRPLGLELNQVTIAAFIIALGILVDNATVIAEDISRRVNCGETSNAAAERATSTLGPPMLISTLATAIAFSPPVFADSLSAEYMRDLAFVMAIVLLISWVVAVTITPLTIRYFISAREQIDENTAGPPSRQISEPWYQKVYRSLLSKILKIRVLFSFLMVILLTVTLFAAESIPFSFLPPSDRDQFQIPFEISPGSPPEETLRAVQDLSDFLNDLERNPDVTSHIAYIGSGGPRFILGLSPPTAATHRAFLVVNTKAGADIANIVERVRQHIETTMPNVEARPKLFSLGETDAGMAALKITGDDASKLREYGETLKDALRGVPGIVEVHHDWEAIIPRLKANMDDARMLAAGLTHDKIARTIESAVRGAIITVYQEHDAQLPVFFRAPEHERSDFDALRSLNIERSDGQIIPLSAVADFALVGEPSVIQRHNHRRAITISGLHRDMTAQQLVDYLQPNIENLSMPDGYELTLDGEIREASESAAAVTEYLPHCLITIFGLFILQFNSVRRAAIIAVSVPFCLVGVSAALLLTRMPFDFMSFLGIFALIGTIVSNAILVIERVDQLRSEGLSPRQALIDGATQRLRPIMLTQLTTILGLVPLMLASEPLWRSFNVVVVGGLIAGTLISLGLVPALYALFFRVGIFDATKGLDPGHKTLSQAS
ncbi:MAG: efflux RND transporter permease subunit [Pseudomonadota bacterium]